MAAEISEHSRKRKAKELLAYKLVGLEPTPTTVPLALEESSRTKSVPHDRRQSISYQNGGTFANEQKGSKDCS